MYFSVSVSALLAALATTAYGAPQAGTSSKSLLLCSDYDFTRCVSLDSKLGSGCNEVPKTLTKVLSARAPSADGVACLLYKKTADGAKCQGESVLIRTQKPNVEDKVCDNDPARFLGWYDSVGHYKCFKLDHDLMYAAKNDPNCGKITLSA